jgi:hypothetical protein
MVVGKDEVLRAPRAVTLRARTVRVGSKRCAVARNTPLAALLGTGLRVRLRDYGSCGRRARDSGSLFVRQVGSERNRGRNGWVYKVGRKAGATVTLGSATATTAADGTATLPVPAASGRIRLTATRAGMVDAFPREVAVS